MISLVISIIVMLILAGVSISAIVGEDGLLTKAQQASFANKLATYNEEFEMNAVEAISDEGVDSRDKITLMNEYVKQYVPSLEDNDIGQFAIINGQLYYVGDEELEREVCKSQGYNTLPEGMTVEEFASSVESSAIEEILKNMTGDAFTSSDDEGNTQTLGVQLWDKNFTNGNKWKIITEVENGENKATYGTEWYYVEAGQNIEGIGILKNSYIINYTTRKAVRFDANKHTMLAYGANIAVNHNLSLNIDPINMSSNSTDSWGNVQLSGFSIEGDVDDEGNVISGYDGTSIKLDGVDDEIIFYGSDNFSEGFTLSYYGKMINNTIIMLTKQDAVIEQSCRFKCNVRDLYFNTTKNMAYSAWSINAMADNNGNLSYAWDEENIINNGDIVYVDLSFEPINNTFYVYRNGHYISSASVDPKYWDGGNIVSMGGKQAMESNSYPYRIGSLWGGAPAEWSFAQEEIYSIRLYNTALTSEEILANYNATVSYHNILVNNGNASTGGETGGDDINNIE